MKHLLITFLLFAAFTQQSRSYAQDTGTVSGMLKDSTGAVVPFVTVYLEGTSYGTTADENGKFTITNIPQGNYTLIVSSIGYHSISKNITIHSDKTIDLQLTLSENKKEVEVVIHAKSEKQQIRESGFSVETVETTDLKTQSTDLNKILDHTPGIRVQRSGGVGSDFRYSLNGLSGSAVRFFVDGIPMDYFGSAYSINNLPVSQIDRIDIYKGVVPVNLGSDALGGAINIITSQQPKSYLEGSYSYSSFNTHQLSLQGQWVDSASGFTARASGFYNYTDNSYKVWGKGVYYADSSTGYRTKEFTQKNPATRFNDDFKTTTAKIDIGFKNKSWTDQFFIGLVASDLKRGIQTGQTMGFVYGDVRYNERFYMPNMTFQKKDFFVKGLAVNVFASYAMKEGTTVDTTNNVYDWRGHVIAKTPGGGEISHGQRRSMYTLKENAFVGRLNTTYHLSNNQIIGFNYVLQDITRSGADPYKPDYTIPYVKPQYLTTTFAGLSLESKFFNQRLITNVFVKYFGYNATINELFWSTNGADTRAINNKKGYPGGGVAIAYKVVKPLLIKFSIERAVRMPAANEAMGDGITIINAPYIKPEKSLNVNLGLLFNSSEKNKKHFFQAMANTFYRNTKDQILLSVNTTNSTGQYKNIDETLNKGFELELRYKYHNKLEFAVNTTYLNIRDNQKINPENKQPNITYGDRLRNTPYLMANASIRYRTTDVIQKNSRLFMYIQAGYVHEYYLNWPSLGNKTGKNMIPTQLVFDIGLGYTFPANRITLAFDVSNLLNEQVYDNFLLQKPGRMYSIKISYRIQQK